MAGDGADGEGPEPGAGSRPPTVVHLPPPGERPPHEPVVRLRSVRLGTKRIEIPDPAEEPEAFEAAAQKLIVQAMFEPASYEALLDGLKTVDVRERRLWWQLAREMSRMRVNKDGEGGSVKIVFNQQVPGPPTEDGPTFDVTPRK
jgi:hypothetical protein